MASSDAPQKIAGSSYTELRNELKNVCNDVREGKHNA